MLVDFWKRDVYILVTAQFLVIVGFSFVNPFMPLYLQNLGGLDSAQAAFWGGLSIAAGPIAMFLSAPLWGMVGDRWGRKPMVVRAAFAAGTALGLIGLAPNIYTVVGLRFAQGLFGGTVAAVSALAASITPRNRLHFSMGILMVSMFIGTTLGPLLGGFIADLVGFRNAFFVTGGIMWLGGLLVLVSIHEKFERPSIAGKVSLGTIWRLALSRKMLPVLTVMVAINIGPQMVAPVIPLFIKEMDPTGPAASASGLAFGMMGITAAISSAVYSRIGGRVSIKKMLVFSCLACAAVYLPPLWAATVLQLVALVALVGLVKGGLVVASNSLIGLTVQATEHGIAYGLGQSANSLGNGLGPLLGGSLVSLIGLRPVFAVAAVLFLVVAVIIWRLMTAMK